MCLKCLGSFLLSSGIVAYVAYVSQPGSSLFSYHPACMCLAFVGLLSAAVNSLCPRPLLKLSRPTKVFMHWLVSAGAGVAALVGFSTIYYNKELNDKPHFVSWHGQVGLTASALLLSQLSFGALVKYPSVTKALVSYRLLRFCHVASGLMVYVVGCLAFGLGVFSTWFQQSQAAVVVVGILTAQAVVAGTVLWGVVGKVVGGSPSKQKSKKK